MYKVKILENHTAGHTHARIGISLGQDYCQGAKFQALLHWAAERFETVEIMIADTLNRWNTLAGDSAVTDWQSQGNLWRRQNILTDFPKSKLQVAHWKEYYALYYERFLPDVLEAYHNNPTFRHHIDQFATRILIRRGADRARMKYYRSYLIEEVAVNLGMGDKANIYPGSVLNLERYFENAPTFTRIDFLRRKQFKAAA